MKRVYKIAAWIAAAALTVCSCVEQQLEEKVEFGLDKPSIAAGPEGKTEMVRVSANGLWTVEVGEEEPWVKVTPSMGDGSTDCLIEIDSTVMVGSRNANIIFSSERQKVKLHIDQMGFEKSILLDTNQVSISNSSPKKKRFFESKITTNVKAFKLEITDENGAPQDWVIPEKSIFQPDLEYGDRPVQMTVRLNWKINPKPEERTANIKFITLNKEDELSEPVVLTVTQKAAPVIEDNAKGDSLALLIIQERLNASFIQWDGSESIKTWKNVVLWEESDTLPAPDALGRVRGFKIQAFNTDESIPEEISHLKYVEEVIIMSNVNTFLKHIELGPEICRLEHLKYLNIGAYGLVSLPDEFVKLGDKLEFLSLWGNQLNEIPDWLNQFRFPKLKALDLVANDRWTINDLREKDQGKYKEDGLGLYINTRNNDRLKRLFTWDNLEYLNLSNNLFEGSVPDFTIGEEILIDKELNKSVTIKGYTEDCEEYKELGDTISFLLNDEKIGKKVARILPKAKRASYNLCFLTGKLPDWVLYHPFLLELAPESLIFNQRSKSYDSIGNLAGFTNLPENWDYYLKAYPLYEEKYFIPKDKQ